MKKIKQIILTLLVVSFFVNPMYLTLRVHAANEEIAMSRISDRLQSAIENSGGEEPIEVMIWLEDINTSSVVLSSTEDILGASNVALSSRGLCEIPVADEELYSQYMSARKEAMRVCYEEYTQNFAELFLDVEEIVYLSKYSPVVIACLTNARVIEISDKAIVRSLDYYCDDVEETSDIEERDNSYTTKALSNVAYPMSYVKRYLGINDLITYIGSNGDGMKIGVLDGGLPNNDYLEAVGFSNNIEIHHYGEYGDYYRHPGWVLEILHSIIPDADYYYATYLHLGDNAHYTLVEEIEWLLQKNVQVISCSLHLKNYEGQGNGEGYSTYGNISEYLDYISSDYLVTIVEAAGNAMETEEGSGEYTYYGIASGGMAYNIITVGNYNIGNRSLDISSEYYQGNALANKPDVCAPGHILFLDGVSSDNGTSYATPIVAGIAALIISSFESIIYPYEVKSIICASCSDHKYSSDNVLFKKYGTGVVDGWYVKQILSRNQQISDYFEPDELIHTYRLTFNDDYPLMDIVLTFEKPYYEATGFDIGNLDLYLYDSDGEYIASSISVKNNVEVLVSIAQDTEYVTLVVQQTQAVPTEGSGITEDICTFYSLSWRHYE